MAVRCDRTRKVWASICRCGKEVPLFKQSIMVAFFDGFKINVLQLPGDSSMHSESGRCEVFRRSNILDIELL